MPMSPNEGGALPVERLRLTFAVSDGASYVPHLDLTRAWVRALRRLGAPLAYSLGFNPHPRISLAAPLPVGFAAERELLDVLFEAPVDASDLAARLRTELPRGLTLCGVEPVPLQAPPLPSQVVAADYVICFHEPPPDLAPRVERLLAEATLPFARSRAGKQVSFDLRPRILAAEVRQRDGQPVLYLRLAHGPSGAARPDDVLTMLGLALESARITRTQLVLAGSVHAASGPPQGS